MEGMEGYNYGFLILILDCIFWDERNGFREKENSMLGKQYFHDKLLFSILKIYLYLNTTFVDVMGYKGDPNVIQKKKLNYYENQS